MKERVKYCDFLRFVAIISVLFIHIFADFRDGYLLTNRNYYFILTFFDSFTRTGVPLFFMLTGIFMLGSKKKEKYCDFLKKRVSKLLIPFFVISAFYYIYDMIKIGGNLSILQFLNAFTSNQIKYHFWFMYSILLIYLLIPFLKKMVQNLDKKELRTLIFVILLSNFLSVICTISKKFDYSFFSMFLFSNEFRYLNYMFLGYYLYSYGIPKKYHKGLYFLGVLSLLLMPILDLVVTSTIRYDAMLVAGSIFPFILTTAFFTFVKENYSKWKLVGKLEGFFTFTTPIIFYIYMIHIMVMNIVKEFLFRFLLPDRFINVIIFIIFEFFFTFIISYIIAYILYLLYSFIEKQFFSIKRKRKH